MHDAMATAWIGFNYNRQNQQLNERFEKLLETVDQRFTVMMQALENLALDKCNYSLEKRNMLLHKPVTKGPELRLSAHMYGPEPCG